MATKRKSRPKPTAGLCGLVKGLANHIEDHLRDRAVTFGLTASQGTALCELTRPMTLRELAERMSCEPSNATFVVDRLEDQGLLERRAHPDRPARQATRPHPRGHRPARTAPRTPHPGLTAGPSAPEEQELLQHLLTRALIR